MTDASRLGLETARFLLKTLGCKGNIVIIEGVKGSLKREKPRRWRAPGRFKK